MNLRHALCSVFVSFLLAACGSSSSGTGSGDSGLDVTSPPDSGGDVVASDAGSDVGPPSDSAPPGDAAREGSTEGGADGIIHCGNMDCTVGRQICCYTKSTGTETCAIVMACGTLNNVPIPCDDTADCVQITHMATSVCCATAGTGGVTRVACTPAAQCTAGLGDVVLCDPMAPTPCPTGTCGTDPSLPAGFHACM